MLLARAGGHADHRGAVAARDGNDEHRRLPRRAASPVAAACARRLQRHDGDGRSLSRWLRRRCAAGPLVARRARSAAVWRTAVALCAIVAFALSSGDADAADAVVPAPGSRGVRAFVGRTRQQRKRALRQTNAARRDSGDSPGASSAPPNAMPRVAAVRAACVQHGGHNVSWR
eukprot:3632397-Pleurochrysis_carterae.AAC.1